MFFKSISIEKRFHDACFSCFEQVFKKYSFKLLFATHKGCYTKLTFMNGQCGLVIIHDLRDGILIYVVELKNNEVGKYDPARWIFLETLMRLKGEKKNISNTKVKKMYKQDYIESVLKQYANVLIKHGAEIFNGEFAEIKEEQELVRKENMEKYPGGYYY